jgi:hypothetical protein
MESSSYQLCAYIPVLQGGDISAGGEAAEFGRGYKTHTNRHFVILDDLEENVKKLALLHVF